eukprot:scaffold8737_cov124-Isochrysis_galbana.AAC.5
MAREERGGGGTAQRRRAPSEHVPTIYAKAEHGGECERERDHLALAQTYTWASAARRRRTMSTRVQKRLKPEPGEDMNQPPKKINHNLEPLATLNSFYKVRYGTASSTKSYLHRSSRNI